jgi:hypothetical protein
MATAVRSAEGRLSSGDLAKRLNELGLWRGLDEDQRSTAVQAVAGGAHPWSTEMAPSVSFFADGEDLAEEGVEDFLMEVAPSVKSLGVELDVTTELQDRGADTVYAVTINGTRVEIYNGLAAFERDDDTFAWFTAQNRPLARVNELLAAAGAKERFFILYPGTNDGLALLIDPDIPAAIALAGFTEPDEIPLLAA